MDYKEIKNIVSMNSVLDRFGIALTNGRCACPLHDGKNKSAFSVHSQGQAWTCHTQCGSGDIFNFIEKKEGVSNIQAKAMIEEMFNLETPKPIVAKKKKMPSKVKAKTVYKYTKPDGTPCYEIHRVDTEDGKKSFKPYHNGEYKLDSSDRVLYNLSGIDAVKSLGIKSGEPIIICEGEKTADAIISCQFAGTTNPFGSSNWMDKYADSLVDMDVVIFPDADQQSEKWKDVVLKSLKNKVNSVKIIKVPDMFIKKNPQFSGHDFADMLEIAGKAYSINWMLDEIEGAEVMPRGVDPSIVQTPRTLYRKLKKQIEMGDKIECFNINSWFPSMNYRVQYGDLIVMMANTSVGKSRLLQNIPYHVRDRNFVIFDLELSLEVLAMRYCAMENGLNYDTTMDQLNKGYALIEPNVDHVNIQKIPRMSINRMRARIDEIEMVTGERIDVVAIDYIGLMSGTGSVYERTSTNVEEFKAFLSETNRVGILTTQCSRSGDDGRYECPSLHDAKNSGSVENSGQLVLAFWLDNYDETKMFTRALKYSHGKRETFDIELKALDLRITEPSNVEVSEQGELK